jgi:hypothetical protein
MVHAYLLRGHVSDAVMQTSRSGFKPKPPPFIFSLSSLYRITYSSLSFTTTTGDVRILTDFRILNAQIKRKPFPLPKISDLLRKLSGFKYATEIDLNIGYYHITLDLESQKMCTTILPWGKYQYKRLPMGGKTSPDIFQRIMYELLGDMPNIQLYLDDILITSNVTFEEHAAIMEQVLHMLNYSHSHNPRCAHGRSDKSKRPESHSTKDCARARVFHLKTEPNYYYCPITLVMT